MKSYASFIPEAKACQRSQDPEQMRRLVARLFMTFGDGPEDADLASRLFLAGSLCAHLRDGRQAELLFRRARLIFDREGDRAAAADCARHLGRALLESWEHDAAIEPLTVAVDALAEQAGDTPDLVPVLSDLARACSWAEDTEQAIAALERCTGIILRASGRRDARLADLCGLLGSCYLKLGQAFRAEASLNRSIACARVTGNDHRLGWSLRELGKLLASQGRTEEALPLLEEALAVARRTSELGCCLHYFRADLAAVKRAGVRDRPRGRQRGAN